MTPPEPWTDEQLDEKFAELDLRHKRTRRALRDRPTKRQVRQLLDERPGRSLSRMQLAIAVVGAASAVLVSLIAAYVQIKTSTPIPIPGK